MVVEAEAAACLYKGAVADDGNPRIVEGDLETIMAGLAWRDQIQFLGIS